MSLRQLTITSLIVFSLTSSTGGTPLAAAGSDTSSSILFASQKESAEGPSAAYQAIKPNPAQPSLAGVSSEQPLLGRFFGMKQALSDVGIDCNLQYRGENFSNIHGGAQSGNSYIYQFDFSASVSLQQTTGWRGATLCVQGLLNNGGSLKTLTGDAQGPSNLEAIRTTKLYQAWIEQTFSNDFCSLRAGLYDLNSEFYVTSGAGLFLNSSFGVGSDLAQTGEAGPSIFPNTALAVRAQIKATPTLTLQAAVLDAVPGMPGEPSTNEFRLSSREGALLIAEAIYSFEPGLFAGQSTFSFGAWRYTASFEDLTAVNADGSPLMRNDNAGAYVTASHQLFSSPAHSSETLTAFLRFGIANRNINAYSDNLACGLVCAGLIPGRESDICGVACTRVTTGGTRTNAESTLELTYLLSLASWCAVQCDMQYIVTPGAMGQYTNATVGGMRFELQL